MINIIDKIQTRHDGAWTESTGSVHDYMKAHADRDTLLFLLAEITALMETWPLGRRTKELKAILDRTK